MITVQRMTAQEYLAIGDDRERMRCELVEGEVIVTEPDVTHQFVCGELFAALHTWTRSAAGRGSVTFPLDVLVDERNVFAPDLLWYPQGQAPARGDAHPYPLPGLAVEVRSPSTWRYDLGAKKAAYERNGLQELWLIESRVSELLAFRRSTTDSATFDVALEIGPQDTLGSPLLPGFGFLLGALFTD